MAAKKTETTAKTTAKTDTVEPSAPAPIELSAALQAAMDRRAESVSKWSSKTEQPAKPVSPKQCKLLIKLASRLDIELALEPEAQDMAAASQWVASQLHAPKNEAEKAARIESWGGAMRLVRHYADHGINVAAASKAIDYGITAAKAVAAGRWDAEKTAGTFLDRAALTECAFFNPADGGSAAFAADSEPSAPKAPKAAKTPKAKGGRTIQRISLSSDRAQMLTDLLSNGVDAETAAKAVSNLFS